MKFDYYCASASSAIVALLRYCHYFLWNVLRKNKNKEIREGFHIFHQLHLGEVSGIVRLIVLVIEAQSSVSCPFLKFSQILKVENKSTLMCVPIKLNKYELKIANRQMYFVCTYI